MRPIIDRDGRGWPSITALARARGVSREAVRRRAAPVASQLVERPARPGGRTPDIYAIDGVGLVAGAERPAEALGLNAKQVIRLRVWDGEHGLYVVRPWRR